MIPGPPALHEKDSFLSQQYFISYDRWMSPEWVLLQANFTLETLLHDSRPDYPEARSGHAHLR